MSLAWPSGRAPADPRGGHDDAAPPDPVDPVARLRRRHLDAADAFRRLARVADAPRTVAALDTVAERRHRLARELRPHARRGPDPGRSRAWAWIRDLPRHVHGARLARCLRIAADREAAAAEECERLLERPSSRGAAVVLERHARELRRSRGSLLASAPW